ncbi:MAG: DUF1501 domain-containing protein [Planctomycetota bacterium]|jgi:hypothetical protein|nr:DUF1501 domain-containing protein [Planctomycetota bacterium]MEC8239571.1 DUF1501 domain-containing protein [Planctomycetota bacterium]MEC8302374.1 DUF1501 domain-containing protein [Planctomycetota bacterium]MEC8304050.1 DUF1501 domain-containing protein [Planctomycetota bacterium]MEC8863034.1 DUF1501 domain-containing protein [Planctomycetota bacterium]
MTPNFSRRKALLGLGATLGSVALTSMLDADENESQPERPSLRPKKPMHPPKAKRVIMLFMEGGPGQMDTFDPKPELTRLHKSESHLKVGQEKGFKFFVGSPFRFRKVSETGVEMSEPWQHMSDPYVADELCNFRGCQAESLNHPEALFHMNTGSRLGGDPALGSWTTYGLGTVNQNLPGYVVMTELALPQGGATNWSNGFLPPHFQGTRLRPNGSPILDLTPPDYKTSKHQRRALDELARLNQMHLENMPVQDERMQARIDGYELAYRMQAEVPGVIDLSRESPQTHAMYGLDEMETREFGRQCLMARRMLESGVRFVQIFSGGWDSHDYLERGHTARIKSVDKPMAALLRDLKQRGLLEETLVIWTGEFGRTADNNKRGGVYSIGRGHNNQAMTMLMAGGGVKPGVVGATDDFGAEAVECVHPIRDLHVTLLHLLGLDDNKLTYFHGGRFKQLSQFGGQVIEEIIA